MQHQAQQKLKIQEWEQKEKLQNADVLVTLEQALHLCQPAIKNEFIIIIFYIIIIMKTLSNIEIIIL